MGSNTKRAAGFTLVELLVAVALGLIVLAATTQLFKGGMDATVLVSQQSEMQQNVSAALNLITKDVSMAGAGLPSGGFALPNGAGSTTPLFAVDPNRAWLANNSYPAGIVAGTPIPNYMYGVIPGPGNGMESGGPPSIAATRASGLPVDAITVIYADYSFPLNQYSVTFLPPADGTAINVAPPAAPPAGFPAILSPTGIQVGDLILLTNSLGSAVGEVTGISNAGGTIQFANTDPLNVNQSGAAKGNIKYIAAGANTVANRIWAVTYFLEVPPNGQPPRLMRQVSGQTPVPVADNIIGLSFTYDVCDGTNGPNCSAISDPIGKGYSPNQINKVNIQIKGQTLLAYTNKSRSMVLGTSVSTRSLSFKDRY
jgi:prepilin-type N-terminal cleavage/methylation domain-containing protein